MTALILSIDSLSVTLTEFAVGGYDRSTPESGEVEYSLNGTPIADGHYYEPKEIWTIQAFAEEAIARTVERIFKRSERYRAQELPFAIQVADYIKNCVEDGPRTRQLAPGGTVTALEGDGVSYPAVYKARLFQPRIAVTGNGHTWSVNFVLKELDKVTA